LTVSGSAFHHHLHHHFAMPITLPKSRAELDKASNALARIRSATSVADVESAWVDFLHSLERSWNKLHAQLKSHRRFHSWRGRYESLRKDDELLSYVTNARGAHEHTLAETTMIPYSQSSLHDHSVRAGGEGLPELGIIHQAFELTMQADGANVSEDLKVSDTQEHKARLPASEARLPSITNRGRRYGAPTSHLGASVDPTNVAAIAGLALDWYFAAIAAAEAHFD
jgi:hypothetical protein